MTDAQHLPARAVALARSWVDSSPRRRVDPAARRLSELLADPDGLQFTIDFVDRVIRPEDHDVAAANLRGLARRTPAFLPWYQRSALRWGARFSRIAPGFVVRTATKVLRRLVGHLVVDARPEPLGRTIAQLTKGGHRLNLNLLGEAVLGEGEAARRRDAVVELLGRPDVDYVSVKVSSVASRLSLWGFDATVERVVTQLRPIYAAAIGDDPATAKFVNLDMEEYRDLDLTIAVFTRALDEQPDLTAGIVLQAYLPDVHEAYERLHRWAYERRLRGGAPVKIRVVKGANLAMERVDAEVHDWPLATWGSKAETDASYKRLLDTALRPDRVDAIRVGVAGQNLFDIAWAWLLAEDRGVTDAVDVEMLLGMDAGPVRAVRGTVGRVLLYTPVVHPDEFDVAIAYLVRRLEENASSENFMSSVFRLTDTATFTREADRFLASVDLMGRDAPSRHRVQDRRSETFATDVTEFENTADTDPSIAGNRAWALDQLERSAYTSLGANSIEDARIHGPAGLETLVRQTRAAGSRWQARDAQVRSWLLHQAGHALAHRRGDLVSVMAAEAGKTVAQADVEVSEAIDFAHYYAESLLRLEAVDGATFVPSSLTVVTPPWNFPVAIPAGSMLAALAAGSAVIVKPAPQSQRCAAVVVEALWQAGIPREALRLVTVPEGPLSKALVAHSDVDRVILTGGWETARLFRSWRPDLHLHAETSGKNALVVTPSADLDLAVADLVQSAFGHAGQKCSAASLAILVGSVGDSERFGRQLVDAVRSMRVAHPTDPSAEMGPLIEPPGEKLTSGLTELGEGESWLVEPRQLDDSGRLWSPGVRAGVRPGSEFHRTEYFGPILGLMHAPDLATAIAWQNATDYGLTAGLHSLDPQEISTWVDQVQAGNLYVNRGTTGAIVQRQPFGGWKRSTVGPTTKAGGPNYLVRLGEWTPRPLRRVADVDTSESVSELLANVLHDFSQEDVAWLDAAARSDELAWRREFGLTKDVSRLHAERNLLRYLPVPVTVRVEGSRREVLRLVLAAVRTGAPIVVSTNVRLVVPGFEVHVEDDDTWLERLATTRPERVRLVRASHQAAARAVDGDPDVAFVTGDVTQSGRIELLTFLHEQSISITHHRFGNPVPALAGLLPRGPR
ncbi:bifunctional proline dehydrogenase/L-glutamate gamma-semialdehyde dehydrogenase [Aeromicrobium sp. Leaf350]|uniref:bifunctional proline dehydrogenase/L-glutamate gamma-semialdehyde dehydrogenase n=1 Tax=Aeromicrobium sp. Leaf350 TaxID=2876565 RepID=UPI001E3CD89A|nr:bifunctional proline dehydrogenase/L-glutamate gamma-semialdehyde dehydrogenase [Aeromicrobium sp. Leaf350]